MKKKVTTVVIGSVALSMVGVSKAGIVDYQKGKVSESRNVLIAKSDGEMTCGKEMKEKVKECKKMMEEADANADADKERRELVEARNNAEALAHQTEKQVEEHGDKVSEEVKTEIETAVKDLKEAAEGDNTADIQAKHQTLMTAAMKLGETIYASQQEETAHADAASDAAAEDDDVVDADFEEVDSDEAAKSA